MHGAHSPLHEQHEWLYLQCLPAAALLTKIVDAAPVSDMSYGSAAVKDCANSTHTCGFPLRSPSIGYRDVRIYCIYFYELRHPKAKMCLMLDLYNRLIDAPTPLARKVAWVFFSLAAHPSVSPANAMAPDHGFGNGKAVIQCTIAILSCRFVTARNPVRLTARSQSTCPVPLQSTTGMVFTSLLDPALSVVCVSSNKSP